MPKKKMCRKTAQKKENFRSKLEEDIAEELRNNNIEFDYEPNWGKIQYIIPSKKAVYNPDFYIKTRSGKTVIIECKGIWIYADRYKHLLIKKSRPDLDIRLVFSNSKNKIRKGSKTTYQDICEGRGKGFFKGVKWQYADRHIPQEWLEE